MKMTREKAETIFASVLADGTFTFQELKEALLLAIQDMHKMAEIEEIVRVTKEQET